MTRTQKSKADVSFIMLKEEEKEWMRDPQPWMHGFKSTGNREEDERLIEYKRLNWNHYVWRVADDSKRTCK